MASIVTLYWSEGANMDTSWPLSYNTSTRFALKALQVHTAPVSIRPSRLAQLALLLAFPQRLKEAFQSLCMTKPGPLVLLLPPTCTLCSIVHQTTGHTLGNAVEGRLHH